ncbi:cryptochrome/photolyase family protein [Phenylobacterium soli]|uniref:Deoxyribodipyrimidine photo-lyase n=1 Tax=Phenylobacterium soli TaxID=2170551 RepID=A0A328AL86_9CAUL|nr:deoxyribodipyrimidine photo-lyase [Phenylobacterium soli]RAK55672.1 deoxyribodipyrimidine photo-lyase [Phenylobacterium soli]
MTVLVWFRRDLRLADNPALAQAIATGEPILPLYVLDDEDAGCWAPGAASRWWLHGSLTALDADLKARSGGRGLALRRGSAERVVGDLARTAGVSAVLWNRCYEPWAVARDARLMMSLRQSGIAAISFNGSLLTEPGHFLNRQGEPYRVFTPFWRALRAQAEPVGASRPPERIDIAGAPSERLADWDLLPTRPDWAGGLRETWTPGEAGARARLKAFLAGAVFEYGDMRNRPDRSGTSRLSPHLHFGEISPWAVWRAVTTAGMARTGEPFSAGVDTFLSELAWREFSAHLLFHFPDLPTKALKPEYDRVGWRHDRAGLEAWRRGRTGYPIVDAGMRELWATGWMHNRVRMIVASLLIKDLLIDWREGEAWFWDTLVDADLANNAASWQWVAGSGADASPWFRIFNPVTQGETFDPDGDYVRRWIPELAKLPTRAIHAPWTAGAADLAAAGVRLGDTYPRPIVDHAEARRRTLDAYAVTKA